MRTLYLLTTTLLITLFSANAFSASTVTAPKDFHVCPGSSTTAVFTVSPYLPGVGGFQWQGWNYSTSAWENLTEVKFRMEGTKTSTLSITPSTSWTYISGKEPKVRCRYTYNYSTYYTGEAYVRVSSAVTITSQTAFSPSTTACAGSSITVSVTATGPDLSYQWYRASSPIFGATSRTYTYTASYPHTTQSYYCRVVPTGCGTAVNSTTKAEPTHLEVPVISAQPPATRSGCEGTSVSMSLTASSSTTLNYTWKKNGTNISPAQNSATCTYNPASTSHSGTYTCLIGHSGNSCTVTSTACVLTVDQPASITQQPSDITIGAGSTINFQTTVSGGGITYQWQQENIFNSGTFSNMSDTGIAAGTTTSKLSLTSVKVTRRYRCRIYANCTSTTYTNIVTLTVTTAAAITAHPQATTGCVGGGASFSVTALNATGYEWQVSSNSGVNWATTGTNSNSLSVTGITALMDGYLYRVIVKGSGGDATSDAALLTVKIPVTIGTQPVAQNKCKGDSAGLVVAATGSDLVFTWYKDAAPEGTLNDSLIYSELFLSHQGNYYCAVSNFCGTINSSTVLLKVSDLPHANELGNDTTICWKQKVTLDPGAFSSYQWNTGATSRTVDADSGITYSVVVTDANGCKDIASRGINVLKPWDSSSICMVTYDEAKGKNKVIWDRVQGKRIASYNIYKIVGSAYELLGNVKFDSLSVFNDNLSSPSIKTDQYAIKAVDSCGNESNRSKYVSTMLLQASQGTTLTEANLAWSKYVDEGGNFVPAYYYIWKGKTKDNMGTAPIDSVSGILAPLYIDTKFDGKSAYYKIEVRKPVACAPAILKAESGPYAQSLSNIAEYKTVGLGSSEEIPVSVYPNPASGAFIISCELDQAGDVMIEISDLAGKKVFEKQLKAMAAGECKTELETENCGMTAGMYNIKVVANGKITVTKISCR